MSDTTFEFGRYPIELEEGGVKGKVSRFQAQPKQTASREDTGLNVDAYVSALLSNDVSQLSDLLKKDVDAGVAASEVVSQGMIPAMTVVGEKFQNGEIYIPEMMIAARAMSEILSQLKSQWVDKEQKAAGSVIIGTVKGDLHDIGKNLVSVMLEGQGFSVEDLGVSVTTDRFVQTVKEKRPDILAMSALLTTTMVEMKHTIDALKEAGLRNSIKIMVGGAPVTQAFADQIGADGYAYDSPGAAQKCKTLLTQ